MDVLPALKLFAVVRLRHRSGVRNENLSVRAQALGRQTAFGNMSLRKPGGRMFGTDCYSRYRKSLFHSQRKDPAWWPKDRCVDVKDWTSHQED